MQQLHRAQEQMKKTTDQLCRAVDYAIGNLVLLKTRYLRFKNRPKKLQRRFVGPISDQEEDQFSSIRTRTAIVLVSTSRVPQLALEALAGIRMELPRWWPCTGPQSLARTSLPSGENPEVEEDECWTSWGSRIPGNMDR